MDTGDKIKLTIRTAIKEHAGLTDWDDEAVDLEVEDILVALNKAGYKIVKRS